MRGEATKKIKKNESRFDYEGRRKNEENGTMQLM